ncbi:MAG: SH3 domain-containing protein [Desulfomonilaceae bacterium]
MRLRKPSEEKILSWKACFLVLTLVMFAATTGCQEVDTIKRELILKVQSKLLKKKVQFAPRDGIILRPTPLYQTANLNSEILRKLPAESSVHLLDKAGEMFKVRTRDGREGYVEQKAIGGEEIIAKTLELRKSIEGMPSQAEAVTKSKANFRLIPGRQHEIIEILPPGKKLEVYERVVTIRNSAAADKTNPRLKPVDSAAISADEPSNPEEGSEDIHKDVWYKVKIEDGRVGYIFTHNMKLTPPEDISKTVPFMRMIAWRTVNVTDDPDIGAKSNYIVAYAPIGKDPGCDYTRLYLVSWSPKLKRRIITWQLRINGILPITDYHFEGKPGFSVRYLHPTKRDKLVLANFIFNKGSVKKISEEEIPNTADMH